MRKYLHDILRTRHGSRPGRGHHGSRQPGADPYDQADSPLLGRLPTELRVQVYLELLGGRRVHVKIMSRHEQKERVRNHKWRHGICQMPGVPFGPLDDYYQCYYQCLGRAVRRYLDIGILLACRKTQAASASRARPTRHLPPDADSRA